MHAQPKASRSAIVGAYGESLKIAVRSPPVDGAANEALREFLATFFSVPKRNIELKSGAASRKKIFSLTGLSFDEVITLLKGHT